jgi:type IV secretion system protein VirD4
MQTSPKQQQQNKKPVTSKAQTERIIVPPTTTGTKTAQPTGTLDSMQSAISKNFDYLVIGIVVLFILILILQKIGIFKSIKTGSNTGGDQHGTARFAQISEIKDLTTEYRPGDIKVGEVKDWKILTRLVNLPRDLALKHTVIVGPTGAGKSRGFFLPNCHAAGRSSFVATDPKSELWKETAHNQQNAIRFAPTDPDNSAAFNFVAYCTDIDYAENVAGAIVHGSGGNATGDSKFWSDAEEELITGILIHTAHSDTPTPTHLYNILTSGVERIAEILKKSKIPAARTLVASFMESDKKNKSSIIQGLSGKLRFLNNPALRRFTSSDIEPFNFKKLREKPIQAYWCLEQDDVAKLETLTTIFFSIVMTQLLKQKTGKVPVNLYFDEFANVGKIKGFANHITLMRGQGVSINAGLQSISQIESLYGDVDAKTILDNFNNKLLLAGMQGETVEEFSKQLGEYTYTENTESYSEEGNIFNKKVSKTTGVAKHARRLKTADELRRLSTKEIILLSSNLRPIMMKKLSFDEPKKNQVIKKPKFAVSCGQEIPAPEYERIEMTKKKANLDDI